MSLYIGLMSGTSADAVDAVVADFNQGALKRVLAEHSLPIPDDLRQAIMALYEPGENEIERLGQLDVQLGELFAQAAQELLHRQDIPPTQISAIGSHGQTIRHRPRTPRPFTLQIGDPNTIARLTGITTVADLRRADIAWGGQGAPLAPAFHHACFAQPDCRQGVLNIGGIANLTVLDGLDLKCGYDVGPGNSLMDYWTHKLTGKRWDAGGQWALSGRVSQSLLDRLLAHPFFQLAPPKSTGREEFSAGWLNQTLREEGNLAEEDVQATLLELTAQSICREINKWGLDKVYVCGGGVQNTALMSRLQTLNGRTPVQSTDTLGIPANQVEALTFAWLAHQTLRRAAGNSPAVTGAQQQVILGGIYSA